MYNTMIASNFLQARGWQYFPSATFPTIHPVHWLNSHFAVGGPSPLRRLSGMLTAHMTRIAPHNGFPWHGHRAVEIYTWVLEGTLSHEDSTGGKGDIRAGELQRMFAGRGLQHQELNLTDDPVRVIQIWFMADRKFSHVAPHYQQLRQDELPSRRVGDGTIWHLIGDGSPMEQHTRGRLSAITVDAGGSMQLAAPKAGEDLFFYVTDGAGYVPQHDVSLDQYDVILARPDAPPTTLVAALDKKLHALSFYLPTFLS